MCRDAVVACHAALTELGGDGLSARVAPRTLHLPDDVVPSSPAITELADRLFRADIEELQLTRDVSPKEIARFCRTLARWDQRPDRHASFPEVLADQGVSTVRVLTAERITVLDLETLPAERLRRLEGERKARGEMEDYERALLAQKAWVRVDTSCPLEPIDTVDLAFLVEDQADLTQMLHDMADTQGRSRRGQAGLKDGINDLMQVYASLSPDVADERFEQLARSIMALDKDARRKLTSEVLMPELLETGKAAEVLRRLPDSEIVETLETLADLEMGGVGLLDLALKRLRLPQDRRSSIAGALTPELRQEQTMPQSFDGAPGTVTTPEARLSSQATASVDVREYTAHELSIDEETAEAIGRFREAVTRVDPRSERLRCIAGLIPHLRNPDRAAGLFKVALGLIRPLLQKNPSEAARWIETLREKADAVRALVPEIAELGDAMLGRLCSREFLRHEARRIAATTAGLRGGDQGDSSQLLKAFGGTAADSFLSALEAEESHEVRMQLLDLMCAHAEVLAPQLERRLDDDVWRIVRNAVRVLGFARPEVVSVIAPLLDHAEDRVAREAYMALSRIGSNAAADAILERLDTLDDGRRIVAEEALSRFKTAEGNRLAHRLLRDHGFCIQRPRFARKLIRRFVRTPSADWSEILMPLSSLRFRFWRPELARLGWAATAALKGPRA
jgi:plasmid stabilization system protein ParE